MDRRDADRITGSLAFMLALVAPVTLSGCGGQAPPPTQQQSIVAPQQVTVSPAVLQIATGASIHFSVTVAPANAVNTVNWSVSGTGCSGAACGGIDSTGRYTAPPSPTNPSTVIVTATSTADTTKMGTAQTTIVSPQAAAANSFYFVGSTAVTRASATTLLLPDGRVLIVGGEQSGPTAELYNPATLSFQASDATLIGTPVLLNTGEVLVVGAGTAELYDPKTDSTAPTGNLVDAQTVLAATLLANGDVLVLGTHDAEIYDPASGSFALSGPYAAAFGSVIAKAVVLTNGRALVFGGDEPQLFDPTANSFSLTGSLSGTALDGVDLFSATSLQDGRVLVAGGMSDGRTNAAVVYDPTTGQFTATGSMNDARDAHAAVLLLDGRVLVVGGDGWTCSESICYYSGSLSSAELYDPATGTFSRAGNMNLTRTSPNATLLQDGDVLITGGVDSCGIGCLLGPTQSAEIYHP